MARVGQPEMLWVSSSCRPFQRFVEYVGESVDKFGYISRPEGLLYVYRKDREPYDFRTISMPGHSEVTGWGMYGSVLFVWLPEGINPTGTYGELRNLVRDDIPVRVWLTSQVHTAWTISMMHQDGFEFLEFEEGFPGVKQVLFENDGDSIYGNKVSDEEGGCGICHQVIYDLGVEARLRRERSAMNRISVV